MILFSILPKGERKPEREKGDEGISASFTQSEEARKRVEEMERAISCIEEKTKVLSQKLDSLKSRKR